MAAKVSIVINPAFFPRYKDNIDGLIKDLADYSIVLSYKYAPSSWDSIVSAIKVGRRKKKGMRAVFFNHHASYWLHNGFMHKRSGQFIAGIPFFRKAVAEAGGTIGGGGSIK